MKKRIAMAACAALIMLSASAQEVIRLYDGPIPEAETNRNDEIIENGVAKNVTIPDLTVFLPDLGKATGAAMVVCPGGAYVSLSMETEGYNVAQWLNERGIAAFVLKYRTRYFGQTPAEVEDGIGKVLMQLFSGPADAPLLSRFGDDPASKAVQRGYLDGLRAMEIVKERAKGWGVDPERIGIMGFSAGSVVALNVGMYHSSATRPALVAPIYCGWTDDIVVPEDKAPLFLASPQNDLFTPDMPFQIHKAWTATKAESELHFFAKTQHGFGYVPDSKDPVYNWITLLYNFMVKTGFVKGEAVL